MTSKIRCNPRVAEEKSSTNFDPFPLQSNLHYTFLDFCKLDGIDYPNNDLSSATVADETECAKSCQKVPYCALYAYSKSRKQCWLKTKKGKVVINNDIQTGDRKIQLEGRNLFYKIVKSSQIQFTLNCS